MLSMRQRLWPLDRLAIAILLYAIWIPFIAMLVVYVNDNEDSNTTSEVQNRRRRAG